MLAAAGVTAAGAGAVAAVYKTFSGAGPSPAADDEDDEVIVVDDKGEKTSTWKDSSGRDWGGDSYVFGDVCDRPRRPIPRLPPTTLTNRAYSSRS